MGWPALIGLAVSAAGTGMQIAASKKEQSAMESKAQEELSRQQRYQKEAGGEFQKSLAESGEPQYQKQAAQGSQKLSDAYTNVKNIPLTLPAATASSPSAQIVEDRGTQALNKTSDAARAQLGGVNEFQIQQMIKNLRAQQQLGVIATNARMSQGVEPLELQAAGRSAEGLRGVGSLASTLGGLMSIYSAGLPASSSSAATGAAATTAASAGDAYFNRLYGNYPYQWNYQYPTAYQYTPPSRSL